MGAGPWPETLTGHWCPQPQIHEGGSLALTALCNVCLARLQRAYLGRQAGRYQVKGGIESHQAWPG